MATDGPVTFLCGLHSNTRALADDAQAVLHRFACEAFGVQLNGALLNAASSTLTTLLCSGEHTNPVSGLQFLRARFYDPAGGRFSRVDPFGGNAEVPLSLNKYVYGHSNPVANIDPSGKSIVVRIAKFFFSRGFMVAAGAGGRCSLADILFRQIFNDDNCFDVLTYTSILGPRLTKQQEVGKTQ